MENFDIGLLVKDVIRELRGMAERKKLRLSFSSTKTESFIVLGDTEKLRQVITNVIDNAIKYTPKGSIEVALSKNDSDGITLSVVDTGIGILPENIESLFEKFSRAPNGKIVSSGSGLGLYLAKLIISAHNGNLAVSSHGYERGSTFSITLPVPGDVAKKL